MLTTHLLERFAIAEKLEDNWDQDDALAPIPELLEFAKKLIINLVQKGVSEPFFGITQCGTIDLIWSNINLYIVLDEPICNGMHVVYMKHPEMDITDFMYSDYSDTSIEYLSEIIISWFNKATGNH